MSSEYLRKLWRKLTLFLDPPRFKQARISSSAIASLEEKIEWDVLPRPHFAYGVHRAAMQAKALNIERISVIEFGCAGGNGLLALEELGIEVTRETGIQIDIYGFDLGDGLPPPQGNRDLPYAWRAGQFKMDVGVLKAKLKRTQLVLGNVEDTTVSFMENENLAPIGFVSFDLDYYSSTASALRIFEGDLGRLLPRVYCYFDDIIGPDHELHCEFAGELLAIAEFNNKHQDMKLGRINGLSHKRIFPAPWNDSVYVLHAFKHPLYSTYIPPTHGFDMQLSLNAGASDF